MHLKKVWVQSCQNRLIVSISYRSWVYSWLPHSFGGFVQVQVLGKSHMSSRHYWYERFQKREICFILLRWSLKNGFWSSTHQTSNHELNSISVVLGCLYIWLFTLQKKYVYAWWNVLSNHYKICHIFKHKNSHSFFFSFFNLC